MLSRYSGIGSDRYPIGFSGDTIINWESLRFSADISPRRRQTWAIPGGVTI